ncbi:TPA: TPM domain-containing protein [Escherichia coli]|uniref:TPM domain-containing protein n=1 Tax=Escherichia coli TaxID=562 RepID=UPI00112501A5|nr:YgcG family protein [Escherichia coli]EJE3886390.1 YgcG family protein [Escherichia coli]MCX2158361.1 YgcG family protein [Escherichia coli]HBC2917974.1 YgcG family protein [Escherichia coli]HCN6461288.1 YgcG family protein [Escherichia coli]HCO7842576.1 YgcG family protein [Escherichia coli]
MIVMRIILFLLTLWCLPVLAQQIAVPELRQQVTDITGTLSTSEQQSLTQQLQDITQKTRAQVAVLIVPSTGDDTIEQYATRVFDSWKLGDKQRNDGILLLVAWEDHAVRIEVGYGLEGVVTDLQAAKIIRDILIPAFKSDDLMGGLTLASENIGALLMNGELPEGRGNYYSINPPIPFSLAVLILLAVLSYFIVFTDPSNLPWITLTAAIYGMVFLYVAEPGPWTNLIVACGMLTPFAIVALLIFWLIVNKKLRAKYKTLGKERASRKGSSSSSSGGGSGGGGFSGGGGSSGGGGASGRW